MSWQHELWVAARPARLGPVSPAGPGDRASPCPRPASGTGQSLGSHRLLSSLWGACGSPQGFLSTLRKLPPLQKFLARRQRKPARPEGFPWASLPSILSPFVLQAPPSGEQAWSWNGGSIPCLFLDTLPRDPQLPKGPGSVWPAHSPPARLGGEAGSAAVSACTRVQTSRLPWAHLCGSPSAQ